MTRLALILALISMPAAALGPKLTLPPSDGWQELVDPAPPPEAKDGRFFVWKANPNVRLRIGRMPALKADYTSGYVSMLAERLAKQAREGGAELHISEAVALSLEGASVGRLKMADQKNPQLQFWLPGSDGDVLVVLFGVDGSWDTTAEKEVEHAIYRVEGLRKPSSDDEWLDSALGIGGAVLAGTLVLFAVLFSLQRRRAAPQ
jgi:hypothetical protein